MQLLLQRFLSGSESTLGLLWDIVGSSRIFMGFSLEDQYNPVKIPGETRIPAGKYQILLRTEGGMHPKYASRFPWHHGMLHLQNVPGFEYVYIHVGNDDDDTEGCILMGDGCLTQESDDSQLSSSTAAYKRLYMRVLEAQEQPNPEQREVWITVCDP